MSKQSKPGEHTRPAAKTPPPPPRPAAAPRLAALPARALEEMEWAERIDAVVDLYPTNLALYEAWQRTCPEWSEAVEADDTTGLTEDELDVLIEGLALAWALVTGGDERPIARWTSDRLGQDFTQLWQTWSGENTRQPGQSGNAYLQSLCAPQPALPVMVAMFLLDQEADGEEPSPALVARLGPSLVALTLWLEVALPELMRAASRK